MTKNQLLEVIDNTYRQARIRRDQNMNDDRAQEIVIKLMTISCKARSMNKADLTLYMIQERLLIAA